MWMLGTEPRASGRVANAPNHWAIFPAPVGNFVEKKNKIVSCKFSLLRILKTEISFKRRKKAILPHNPKTSLNTNIKLSWIHRIIKKPNLKPGSVKEYKIINCLSFSTKPYLLVSLHPSFLPYNWHWFSCVCNSEVVVETIKEERNINEILGTLVKS